MCSVTSFNKASTVVINGVNTLKALDVKTNHIYFLDYGDINY